MASRKPGKTVIVGPAPDLAPSEEKIVAPAPPVPVAQEIRPVSMRVYVAGPYTSPDPAANVEIAMQATLQLMRKGHYPFCPHLSHYLDGLAKRIGRPVTYEQWVEQDLVWLAQCDAVLRLPGASPGADREVAEADRLQIPVYLDVAQVPNVTGVEEFGPRPWSATRKVVLPRTHCKTCGDELREVEKKPSSGLFSACPGCQGLDYGACPDCKEPLFHPGCGNALGDLGYDRLCQKCVRTFIYGDPRYYGPAPRSK